MFSYLAPIVALWLLAAVAFVVIVCHSAGRPLDDGERADVVRLEEWRSR